MALNWASIYSQWENIILSVQHHIFGIFPCTASTHISVHEISPHLLERAMLTPEVHVTGATCQRMNSTPGAFLNQGMSVVGV